MNDNHAFVSLLQSLAVFKQSSWTTFALSKCQDRELKFTYGCEQKFSEIIICSTSCFLTELFLDKIKTTYFFLPIDWSVFRIVCWVFWTQKEVISIKSWFFFNIDKWTSSNEENWTKFLSQSFGNLTLHSEDLNLHSPYCMP